VSHAQGSPGRSTSTRFLVRVCVICLGFGGAVSGIVIGAAQGLLWFDSRRWLALSLLDLSESLGLTSSRPSPFRPWHDMPNLVLLALEAVPASAFLVVVGAVIVWATMPWEELAGPPSAPVDLRKLRAAIRGKSVIVVARSELTLFEYLQRQLSGNAQVALCLDRRWGERRYHRPLPGRERRRADRRRPVELEHDLRFNPFFVATAQALVSGRRPSRVTRARPGLVELLRSRLARSWPAKRSRGAAPETSQGTPAGPGLVELLRSRLARSWPAKRSRGAALETDEPEAGPDPMLPLGFELRIERRPPEDGQPKSEARPARRADPVSEKDPPR
jgi:hypothetical protein